MEQDLPRLMRCRLADAGQRADQPEQYIAWAECRFGGGKHWHAAGLIIAGLVAILLNLLFRLGTAQSASQALDDEQGAGVRRITDFVESQAAIWAARREMVQRAALAALEAAEAIRSADAGTEPWRILAIGRTFDEFNLDIELLHSGVPLTLESAQAPD